MHEEPVEILVALAEKGEIDPWNIDIVEVTDRFLSELERLKELDLRISGRTLFYAATLLRMKSEYLEEIDDGDDSILQEEIDEIYDDFEIEREFDYEDVAEPIERLEREIQRRIGRKRMRRAPVTLYELIKQLKTAEKEERRRHRRRNISPPMFVEADDIVGLAHEEDYHLVAASVLEGYKRAMTKYGTVTLDRLTEEMNCAPQDIYLPLLFLMLDEKVLIVQEVFFGDILILEWHPDAFDEQ
jgi:segregation and condensation protein A